MTEILSNFFNRFKKAETNKHFFIETIYVIIKDDIPADKILEIQMPLQKTDLTINNQKDNTFWDEFEEMCKEQKKKKLFSSSSSITMSNEQKLKYLDIHLGGNKSDLVLLLYQTYVLTPPCEDNIEGLQLTFEKLEEIIYQLKTNGENIDSTEIIKIWKTKFPIRIIDVIVQKHGNNAKFESLKMEMRVQIDLIAESWQETVSKIIGVHLKAEKTNDKYDLCF